MYLQTSNVMLNMFMCMTSRWQDLWDAGACVQSLSLRLWSKDKGGQTHLHLFTDRSFTRGHSISTSWIFASWSFHSCFISPCLFAKVLPKYNEGLRMRLLEMYHWCASRSVSSRTSAWWNRRFSPPSQWDYSNFILRFALSDFSMVSSVFVRCLIASEFQQRDGYLVSAGFILGSSVDYGHM